MAESDLKAPKAKDRNFGSNFPAPRTTIE